MLTNKRFIVVIGFILLAILACQAPGQTPISEGVSPTPNQTLTELFKPPENIATQTEAFSTNSSATEEVSTLTPIPTSTHTISPTETQTPTSTPTETQTQTLTPTVTETPGYSACYRLGEQFYADYVSSPPTIDGVWDEWEAVQYPATLVNYGFENWTDSDDLSSSFRMAWDEKYLYIAAKIGDDVYVQNSHGDSLYKGDSIEILLDTDLCGDYYYSQLSSDDYQLGISPGNPDVNGEKEAFLWFPRANAGGRGDVIIASERSGNTTRIEAAIPWSVFGVYPWAGETFGFAFSVSDNDDPNSDTQQSMVTGVAARRLTDPTTWGTLILQW